MSPISIFHMSLILWNRESLRSLSACNWYYYVLIQRSSKRMSPEEKGLRPMFGESCCAIGESKQDIDQWTQVVEGVVLPERVVSELVFVSACQHLATVGARMCYSAALPLAWSILAALHNGRQDVGWTVHVEGPLLQLLSRTLASSCLLLCEIFSRNVFVFVLLLHVEPFVCVAACWQNHSLSVHCIT